MFTNDNVAAKVGKLIKKCRIISTKFRSGFLDECLFFNVETGSRKDL